MKKFVTLILSLLLLVSLTACGNSNNKSTSNKQANQSSGSSKKMVTLTVGATPVPHAEILKHVQPILKKKGINLKIVQFQDYVTPNKALNNGSIDANYFQHIPYLNDQIKQFGYNFVSVGKIHIEPIGIYSKKYKSLKDLPDGATIIMSNSVSDEPRMLLLLQSAGLIKLKKGMTYQNATFNDIVSNPRHLKFRHDVDAGMLPQIYKNGEGDAVLINTNYALDAGLNPLKDAIALESADSPYANVVVVKKENQNNPAVKTLVQVLQSKPVQDWIKKKYKGAIVPVKG